DIVRDNFERLEKIFREGKSVTGISTGYGELDKLLSGLQPSELIILAGRPSQGKTALALNMAENIAIRGGRWPCSAWKCPRNRCCNAWWLPWRRWTRTNSAPGI